MKLKKGGVSTIMVAVIIAGVVVALLISVVVPMSQQGTQLTGAAVDELSTTQPTLNP